jgi:transcriptional regulator with XRE-family HTH domain
MGDLGKAVGNRVKRLRKSRGLSQEGFGFSCGINRGHMGEIERGKKNVTIETLGKLAHKGFKMTLSRFLSGIEKEPIKQDKQKGQPG